MDDHALVELDPLLSRAAADHAALRAELGVLETFLATYAAQSGEERAWLREARSIHAELEGSRATVSSAHATSVR